MNMVKNIYAKLFAHFLLRAQAQFTVLALDIISGRGQEFPATVWDTKTLVPTSKSFLSVHLLLRPHPRPKQGAGQVLGTPPHFPKFILHRHA